MKKITTIATTVLLITFMSIIHSCQPSAQQPLKDMVKQLSQQCPMQEEPMGELTAINFDEKYQLQMAFSLKPNLWQWLSGDSAQTRAELLKKNMIYTIVNSEHLGQLATLLKDTDKGATLIFKSPQPGSNITMPITAKDLKEPVDLHQLVDLQIELTNMTLPAHLDSVITLIKLFKDGDYLTYYYEVDEDGLNMDLMEEKKEEFKAELATNFTNTDKALLDPIYHAGMTLRYSYNDKEARKVVNIDFTAAEIDSIRKTDNQFSNE